MNNIPALFLSIFALTLSIMAIIVIFTGDDEHRWRHKKKRHKLKLQVHFQTKIKHNLMASINSITLSDALAHTGLITVVDDAGNTYSGTLANVTAVPADPTQDKVTVDPTTPNTIDVQEANPTGGTTAIVKADFTSQGNSTPAAGSTAQSIADGTVFTGLTCQIVLINKVSANLKLQVNF